MYAREIQYVLDHGIWIKNLHAEVIAKDELPLRKPEHVKAYIVNTQPSYKPGEHWVAVTFNRNGDLLYFDSYGLPPMEKEIIDFIHNHSTRWIFNKQPLQSLYAITCGLYCIFVLDAVSRGANLQRCLQHRFYTTDHHRNDRNVKAWFMQTYGTLYKEIQKR